MARFARLDVLNTMVRTGLVPVFHHDDPATAAAIAGALARGGARVIEFTNRGDHAHEVFAALERHCRAEHPGVILGVGTVLDAVTAGLYVNSGANFVVGPVLNPEVARLCNRRKVAYSPGCGTASEISAAEELGCEIVKIFPGAQVGGPAFVRALRGPCPWTLLMPTGGVDISEESLAAWFDAGVPCVGVGSKLVSADIVATGDWALLERRVADTLALIRRCRGQGRAATSLGDDIASADPTGSAGPTGSDKPCASAGDPTGTDDPYAPAGDPTGTDDPYAPANPSGSAGPTAGPTGPDSRSEG